MSNDCPRCARGRICPEHNGVVGKLDYAEDRGAVIQPDPVRLSYPGLGLSCWWGTVLIGWHQLGLYPIPYGFAGLPEDWNTA